MTTLLPAIQTPVPQNYLFEFDSASQFIDVAFDKSIGRVSLNLDYANNQMVICTSNYRKKMWYNNATPQIFSQWMHEAPRQLLDAIDEVKREIENKFVVPTRPRRKMRRNQEQGDELSAEAVLYRRSDGWTEQQSIHKPKQVICLAVNIAINCSMKPEHLIYRGAAIVAIADLLNSAGYSVEVIAYISITDLGRGAQMNRVSIRVPVKSAEMPLDISTLAVCLGEIGFFRLVALCAIARTVPYTCRLGMGYPGKMNNEERKEFDIVIDSDCFSKESSIQRVRETLKRFIGEV